MDDLTDLSRIIILTNNRMEDIPCWVQANESLTRMEVQELRNVDIESDSKVAVNLIKEGPSQNFPHRAIVEECGELIRRSGSNIGHTLREGNRVADKLANLGVDQDDPMVTLSTTPDESRDLLAQDLQELPLQGFHLCGGVVFEEERKEIEDRHIHGGSMVAVPDACLDALAVLSQDRLQPGVCLDAPIIMSRQLGGNNVLTSDNGIASIVSAPSSGAEDHRAYFIAIARQSRSDNLARGCRPLVVEPGAQGCNLDFV
ncbi:hypothetical protein Acr_03g0008170 [Actinidia rufa]|uniref:RNase H type-1 domain-containing protein n=1 Tax=Actinidia rufa TaxID=165716 RepID=A0A7J0EC51_9ERIC|nr:hypothetical protein Acr_03g0008170 [Actinidia rufa]